MKIPLRTGVRHSVFLKNGGGTFYFEPLHIQEDVNGHILWLHGASDDHAGEVTIPWHAVELIEEVE